MGGERTSEPKINPVTLDADQRERAIALAWEVESESLSAACELIYLRDALAKCKTPKALP
jgi:hypothetical protein